MGIIKNKAIPDDKESDREWERGIGIWGVWETVSTGNHFDLKKGGVFRFIPTKIVHEVMGDCKIWDVRG